MSVLRRVWAAPLWAHVTTLGFILLALIPLVGVAASFSPDEGAVIIQARSLQDGRGWIVEHPFPEIDPGDRFYPLGASSQGTDGQAPFAKHPLYPVLLAGLGWVGGVGAMVALSVVGTVAAAGSAALLARAVTGGLERPVLWAVGLGSPLLFDAYLLIAHSIGTAVATAAVLAALYGIRRPRMVPFLAAAALMALAVLLRSEALVFAIALGAGIGITGFVNRRPSVVVGALTVPLAGAAAALAEKQMQVALIGASPGGIRPPSIGGSFLGARIEGFLGTWLAPVPGTPSSGDLLLLVVLLLVLAAAAVVRLRPERLRLLVVLAASVIGLSTCAFIVNPDRTVPGLLVAFPLATLAIVLIDRKYFHIAGGRLLLTVTAGLFMAGILLTQYREGGSAEWGGRYFALAIPLLVVLAVDALERRAPRLPAQSCRWAAAALVSTTAVMSVGAIASIDRVHTFTDQLVDRIVATSEGSAPGDGSGEPVVLSPYPNIPRLAWEKFGEHRWLHNPREDLGGELAGLLRDAAVKEFVFVAGAPGDVIPYLVEYTVDQERSWEMGRWKVSTLVAKP